MHCVGAGAAASGLDVGEACVGLAAAGGCAEVSRPTAFCGETLIHEVFMTGIFRVVDERWEAALPELERD